MIWPHKLRAMETAPSLQGLTALPAAVKYSYGRDVLDRPGILREMKQKGYRQIIPAGGIPRNDLPVRRCCL